MKIFYLILLLIPWSCTVSRNISKPGDYPDFLYPLSVYRTNMLNENGKQVEFYDTLSLKRERENKLVSVLLKNKTIFKGDESQYHYMFEVVNKKYLLISCSPGIAMESGPDNFKRDSVFIYDLHNAEKRLVSMKSVSIIPLAEGLRKMYPCYNGYENETHVTNILAIKNIDFNKNLLSAEDRCGETFSFPLLKPGS